MGGSGWKRFFKTTLIDCASDRAGCRLFFKANAQLRGSRSKFLVLCERGWRHVRQFHFARLLSFSRTRRGCFCGGGCLIFWINCRLRKLTRGNILTLSSEKFSASGAKSSMPSSVVGSTAGVRSERRKRASLLIMSASCFLTCKWRHAFSCRSCLCWKFCKAWRNHSHMRPFIRRTVVFNLKMLGCPRIVSADNRKTSCAILRAH